MSGVRGDEYISTLHIYIIVALVYYLSNYELPNHKSILLLWHTVNLDHML